MSLFDKFLPPPGAPGAVRAAAASWRGTADRLQQVGDDLRSRSAMLGASWAGPAKETFGTATNPFLAALGEAAGLLHAVAQKLDEHADAIEHAQDEYHQCVGAVIVTAGVGVLLTPVTAGGSDGVAGGLVGAEVAGATAIVTTSARLVLAALTDLLGQATALAGRWAVLAGVGVAADAASGMVTYHDPNPVAHLHAEQDLQYALVGALAVPFGAGMLAGVAAIGTGALVRGGATGLGTRLAVGGASVAGADAIVEAALGQGVDPGELVLAGLPLGPAGRGVHPPLREVPLGFADAAEFEAFGAHLTEGLRKAGYGDAVPVFQGSSVTGAKYTTGAPFDEGRRSDFDIALASPTLFERAQAAGMSLRSRRTRTGPIDQDLELETLGLLELRNELKVKVDRDVAFMVYKDLEHALQRSSGIVVHRIGSGGPR